MSVVIKGGEVVAIEGDGTVYEDNGGLRIKARTELDGDKDVKDLPWCFPAMPKIFQSVPKKGELVLIINNILDNEDSQRYYLGPIISQFQKMEKDEYVMGRGSATSNLLGGTIQPLPNLSTKKGLTQGSFPNPEDVAVIGRTSEDVILGDGELDLRCGIRKEPATPDGALRGHVVFNQQDPAYIQMKYRPGMSKKFPKDTKPNNSFINIVSDKINLISHNSNQNFGTDITDQEQLIREEKMNEIMEKLQPAVLGDDLVKLLQLMKDSILYHTHPWADDPPYIKNTILEELSDKNPKDVLSHNVRLS